MCEGCGVGSGRCVRGAASCFRCTESLTSDISIYGGEEGQMTAVLK